MLLQIASPESIDLVRQVVQAHAYWRLKGLAVDLVIWNEDHAGYRQVLQDQIMGLITAGLEASTIDKVGGIFVRAAQQMSTEDRILLQSVARLILSDARGSLAEQVVRRSRIDVMPKRPVPSQIVYEPSPAIALDAIALQCGNGIGGFSEDGREYVVTLEAGQATPAPWCNVLRPIRSSARSSAMLESATPRVRQRPRVPARLPWHNDPRFPIRAAKPITCVTMRAAVCGRRHRCLVAARARTASAHGFGYSVYEHVEDGIASALWVFVAIDAPIKHALR